MTTGNDTNGHSRRGRIPRIAGIPAAVILVTALASADASPDNSLCTDCHADASMFEDCGARATALVISDETTGHSIHADLDCVDCHADLEGFDDFPHEEVLAPVDCGACHDEEREAYRWHGRIAVPGGEDVPTCADCHGTHDILPTDARASRVNPINLPGTCGRCHEDVDLTKKHAIRYQHPVEVFRSSVHGKSSLGGVYSAATCNDCHVGEGTAHSILPPGDVRSPINHFNIPKTCGKCHKGVEMDFWEGIHGQLVLRGDTDSPVCTGCHGEHGIIPPDDPRSRVSPSRVAEATCTPCHESARLNERYEVPTGRLQTFVDSYHGLKSTAGDVTVANCASCHGPHRILPHTDSTSSIHPNNLMETCGQCHPGISTALASTPVHGEPGISKTPLAHTISHIYIVAIIVIIGAMVVHWLIDLRKRIKDVMRMPQFERMRISEVWQHSLLAISFIALVITGFSLRYSDAAWVKLLFGWEGGFPLRGIIHRAAAVILVFATL